MSVKSVEVSGRIFKERTLVELFPDSYDKRKEQDLTTCWTSVFGRNGSGKTTLSHAFWKASGLGSHRSQEAADPNSDIGLNFVGPCIRAENIFVYNEDFVQGIRFASDRLGAVVMLGSQGELKDRLDEAEEQKRYQEKAVDEHRVQLGEEIKFGTSVDVGEGTIDKRFKNLQKDIEKVFRNGGWSEKSRDIKGNKDKSAVRFSELDNKYSQLEKDDQLLSLNEVVRCRGKFTEDLEQFKQLKNSEELKPVWDEETICSLADIDKLQVLLESIPEVDSIPTDDVMKLLRNGGKDISPGITKEYLESGPKHCKLCLQVIEQEWMDKVLGAIEQLNQQTAIGELRKELEASAQLLCDEIQRVAVEVPEAFGTLQITSTEDSAVRERYLEQLRKALEVIKKKKDKPLTQQLLPAAINDDEDDAISEKKTEIPRAQKEFIDSVRGINGRLLKHNKRVRDFEAFKKRLLEENTLLEISDNASLFESFHSIKDERLECEKELVELFEKHGEVTNRIASLKSQQQQTQIAMKHINASLRLIFLSSTRLVLEPKDGFYGIKVNGRSVPLSRLSAGEKNAIALSYFFAQPYSGKQEGSGFSDDLLFVLDDPITSLDRDNAIGIYSMIESEFVSYKKSMVGSAVMQVCVLTHSLSAFNTFDKIANDLFKLRNKRLQIAGGSVSGAKAIKLSYRRLILHAFAFAKKDIRESSAENGSRTLEESYDSVGNEVRRALEEYSFFNFDVGHEGLMNSKIVHQQLEREVENGRLGSKTLDMIQGTLFHLWLNSSSHGEDTAELSDYFDHEVTLVDEQQAVKSVRLILILLSIIHYTGLPGLMKQLPTDKDVQECEMYIERWKTDFEGQQPTEQTESESVSHI